MRRRLIVLGAGCHGRVAVETLQLTCEHELEGYLDDDPGLQDARIDGLAVLGPLARLHELAAHHGVDGAVIGIGNLRLLEVRRRIYESAESMGLDMVRLAHPTAFISPSAQCGAGLFLGPLVAVHSYCCLGRNVCIYSGSTIDHDNSIGDHVFIGPGVHTAGQVTIGSGAYLGPGVVVGSGCTIGMNSVLGAGAVVLEDIPDNVVAFGAPARVKETTQERRSKRG